MSYTIALPGQPEARIDIVDGTSTGVQRCLRRGRPRGLRTLDHGSPAGTVRAPGARFLVLRCRRRRGVAFRHLCDVVRPVHGDRLRADARRRPDRPRDRECQRTRRDHRRTRTGCREHTHSALPGCRARLAERVRRRPRHECRAGDDRRRDGRFIRGAHRVRSSCHEARHEDLCSPGRVRRTGDPPRSPSIAHRAGPAPRG